MFLYLIFAESLYNYFFLQNGKPILVDSNLPPYTEEIHSHVDLFEPTVYEGEYLYSIVGWSFSTVNRRIKPEDYERQIVLISDRTNYFFPVETYPRPDVHTAFERFGMKLTNAGYRAKISPGVIDPGVYQIGFAFHNRNNGNSYHGVTNKFLIRTPNQLKISDTANSQ